VHVYLTSTQTITYAMGLCVIGAAVSLLFSWNKTLAGWVAFLFTAASSALALLTAAIGLLRGPETAVTLWSLPQFGSSLRLYVDGLSSIFILLIATVAVASAFYSIRYMKHYPDYGVARYYPNFLLFIAGMYGIVTTTDMMLFFCFFWQLMTLPSYALIRYEFRKRANVQAANKYLLMMEIACALVMLGAYLLAGSGPVTVAGETLAKYDFDALRETVGALFPTQGGTVALALVLFLVGFGIKAGMWPFGQMWLPDAHPAAPSPVSSLLSGVMIKTGIYGLMRSFLWLIPAASIADYPAQTWGMILAVLGTVTLFIGTMQALKQEQSKRLLAFHSIGQVGYIILGLGACVALLPAGLANSGVMALAAVGFYGALFHTLNHGIFKSLLFLDAGSMLYATGTQDLNRMGGLMKFMPITAVTTLIASFSIAGVPLFNGFASKWSIYVATILGSREAGYLAICGVFGIVTSALTLASFMKFFGAAFLSRTSKVVAERAAQQKLEVPWIMQLPQLALAGLCLAFGLVPTMAYWLIQQTLMRSSEGLASILCDTTPATAGRWDGLTAAGGTALLAPLVVALMLFVLFAIARIISKLGSAERRTADIWLCGYAKEAEVHRYGAHNLYGEVKKYFGWVGGMPKKNDENSH
jgi:hydrogenase-4 component B